MALSALALSAAALSSDARQLHLRDTPKKCKAVS